MANKIIKNKLLCMLLMYIFLISPALASYGINYYEATDFSLNSNTLQDSSFTTNINLNNGEYLKFPHLSYIPVDDHIGTGDDFTINDDLGLYHSFELNLTKPTYSSLSSNQFSIDDIAGYSNQLAYGIEKIESIPEYFVVEATQSGYDELAHDQYLAIAQGFTISWDYAEFYGTDIYLDIIGSGSLGTVELDLFLIKDEGAVFPDVTNSSKILSNCTDNSFTNSNPVPSAAASDLTYYDFDDVILDKGKYFIVANLSTLDLTDPAQTFAWRSKNGAPFLGESYRWDSSGPTWDNCTVNVDYTLAPKLLPLNQFQEPLSFTNPADIELEDNSDPITSLNQIILGTGIHDLESTESVRIVFNNSYIFYIALNIVSNYRVSNSSHSEYSIDWNLSWDIPSINFSSYSNPNRSHVIYTPDDWSNSDFSLIANGSLPMTGWKDTQGYSFDLSSLLVSDTYQGASLNFTTTSQNYLFDSALNSNSYNLGYWEANGTHATGYNGSTVLVDIFIKDSFMQDVLTGSVNFSLYDPNGAIVPIKNESDYTNIIFTDLTSYTVLETTQISAGKYSINTVFDPSINGTDIEGDWTAVCLWQNGTEVGFYTLRISVSKSTTASFFWEETLGSSDFTNSSISIDRINQESVKAKIYYNNVSDPFYSEDGTPIKAAPVAYNTSWGTSGFFSYIGPYYETNILINAVVGNYSITLMATGIYLETHTFTFDVRVFHTFTITPSAGGDFEAYYSDQESYVQFTVEDTSNSSSPVIPDEIAFYLDEMLIKTTEYVVTEFAVTSLIQLELFSGREGRDLVPGSYSIRISVSKQDFIVNYGQENATTTVNLEILTTPTTIDIVSSDDEVHWGNETTITFYYVDTINPENIPEASFNISLDLQAEDAEIIQQTENLGLYSVTFRIFEPQETSINIFVTINKTGYETKSNQLIKSISIINPEEGIPIYIFVIIGIFALVAMVTPLTVFIRRKLDKDRRAEKALFARIYGLYESVLSITKLIIVHSATGLPVYEMDLGSEISLDPSLITGFLTAIASMGVELRGDKTGSVKRLQYRNFLVAGSESGQFTLYTFSETDLNEEIEEKLTVISDWFAKMFSNINEEWDGSTEVFRINLQGITEKIMKEIHLWIFYPFTVSPYKQAEIEELNGLQKRLIEYITDGDNMTISRIFDELDDVKIEIGLPIIFEFIENGILIPVFDAYKIATVRF